MKKKSLITIFACLSAFGLLLTGCNKPGPKGPQGEQGVPGEPGQPGQDGQDGRSVVSIELTSSEGNVDTYTITYSDGTTSIFTVTNGEDGEQGIQGNPGQDGHTPEITIGDNGNWFVDGVDTGIKAQGPQGPEGPQGEQGVPGADGTSVLTGNGVPSDALGKNGDSYIDLATWDYYVKENGTWVQKGNIKGGQGEQGEEGKSAYELAKENGFEGTEEEWLASLNGKGISYIELVNGELIIHYSDGTSVNLGRLTPEEDTSPFAFHLLNNNTYSVKATDYAFGCESLSIPSEYNDLPVSMIEPRGFYLLPNLEEITIPNSVTYIGASAFEGCSGITSVTIPSSVDFIGRYAFYGTSLTEVNMDHSYEIKDVGTTNPTSLGNEEVEDYFVRLSVISYVGTYEDADVTMEPSSYVDIFTKSTKFTITFIEGASTSLYDVNASIYVTDLVK